MQNSTSHIGLPFAAEHFTDPAAAVERVREIYEANTAYLRDCFKRFSAGENIPAARPCLLPLRARPHRDRHAGGHEAVLWLRRRPGHLRDDADAARPVRTLLPGAVRPAAAATTASRWKWAPARQPIPVHFSFAEHDHIEGDLTPERRTLMRDLFDLPDLAPMDDGIANGTIEPRAGRAAAAGAVHRRRASTTRCTACATTPAPRPTTSRTSCCSPTTSSTSTNSCGSATSMMATAPAQRATPPSSSRATSSPAARDLRRRRRRLGAAPPRLPQMPAYHLMRPTAQRHHDGQHRRRPGQREDHHRPHRGAAPARLDDARPLRRACATRQQLGDYVLAHGYVREDHVLDEELPLWVPIPALAEVQLALEEAVADVTQARGLRAEADHAHRHRRQHRQPQLGAAAEHTSRQRRFSQSRAIALDMESATIAANGFRFRVPYGTLLCVSDKPLHGEIKLPGMANQFYRERVDQHLRIGMRAIELLRQQGARPAAQPQAAQLRRGGVPVNAAGPISR